MEIKVYLSDIYFPSAGFLSSEVEGNLVIVPLVNGIADLDSRIYTLSETGFAIWQQLDGKKSMGQVAADLSEQFNCPLKDIEKDVLGITAELVRRGICLKLRGKQAGQGKMENAIDDKAGKLAEKTDLSWALDETEPGSYITSGGELSLSNPGQLELLKSMVERGVPLRTVVRGFSMHPFIRDCDILIIAPLKGYRLALGDIISFTRPESGRLVIHRIIKKTTIGWLIKGDNCPEPDGEIEETQIIGRVTRIERGDKEVRFGLGFEKKLIAYLNRRSSLGCLKKLLNIPRALSCRKD